MTCKTCKYQKNGLCFVEPPKPVMMEQKQYYAGVMEIEHQITFERAQVFIDDPECRYYVKGK